MILVAGGTGRLGTLVVRRLAERGERVRVLSRDPARAAHLAGGLVEVVLGDVRDPDASVAAAAGASVVVSAVHGFVGPRGISPRSVDRDGNAHLVEGARRAGADFVLVSIVGAAPDSANELFRMKHAAECHLRSSAVRATVVRATAFLELWIELLEKTAGSSGRPLVFGRGENPINFVSVVDVAALVERVVTDPTTRGQTIEIGGPQNLTLNDLARAVIAAKGLRAGPRHVPRAALHLMANTIGRLEPQLGRQARAALAMDCVDLSFDATKTRAAFAGLPCTSVADLLS